MKDCPHGPKPLAGWVKVHEPADEWQASALKDLLASSGIPVLVRSRQMPWLNHLHTIGEGLWGELLVPAPYAQEAAHLIAALLESPPPMEE